LGQLTGELTDVVDELREFARGIHPAILAKGGLRPALTVLARRSSIPVDLAVWIDADCRSQSRKPPYYVVKDRVEALGGGFSVQSPMGAGTPARRHLRSATRTCQWWSRNVRTASTLRWSSEVSPMWSFIRMLRTCFSTVPSVTKICWAIPLLDRPSAMRASTSLARREDLQRVVDPADGEQLLHQGGIDHRGTLHDAVERAEKVVNVTDAALQEVAEALTAGEQFRGLLDFHVG
jgi:hypothetical protein